MHGYLGREGTPPAELRAIGRDEVRSYGGEVLTGRVLDARSEAANGGQALNAPGGSGLAFLFEQLAQPPRDARQPRDPLGVVGREPQLEVLAELDRGPPRLRRRRRGDQLVLA